MLFIAVLPWGAPTGFPVLVHMLWQVLVRRRFSVFVAMRAPGLLPLLLVPADGLPVAAPPQLILPRCLQAGFPLLSVAVRVLHFLPRAPPARMGLLLLSGSVRKAPTRGRAPSSAAAPPHKPPCAPPVTSWLPLAPLSLATWALSALRLRPVAAHVLSVLRGIAAVVCCKRATGIAPGFTLRFRLRAPSGLPARLRAFCHVAG